MSEIVRRCPSYGKPGAPRREHQRLRTAILAALTAFAIATGGSAIAADTPARTVERVFSATREIEYVLRVEAALARAQAASGVVPQAAADEISRKASLEYAPSAEIDVVRAEVGHRMTALLHVWRKRLSAQSRASLHYGATTVDIYDTVLSLQLIEAIDLLDEHLSAIDARLRALALVHRTTPMVGRTLGQHALAMTFGKKVAVWIGEIDRHRKRLREVRVRLDRSVIMKGPVGSYAGLGPEAIEVERAFAAELGRCAPYADDWHGARDVYAELALDMALLSRSLARIGQEIFLLQSTDIGEVRERLGADEESSSSMPQKVNPVLSEVLIFHGRTIPRAAEVILDDVVNFFERDNTAQSNAAMGALMIESEAMLKAADELLSRLDIDVDAMRANLMKSGGETRAQAVAQALTPALGREAAEREVKLAAAEGGADRSFAEALAARPAVARVLSADAISALTDPLADLAGAAREIDAVLAQSSTFAPQTCEAP